MDTQGIGGARYRVVPRTLVFVRDGDRVLLVRRPVTSDIWPGYYNGVGGHVEPGEGLEASARREVREETGLEVEGLVLQGILHRSDARSSDGVLVVVFTAEAPGGATAPGGAEDRVWIHPSEAESMEVVPDVPDLLARLGGERGVVPFVAHAAFEKDARPVFVVGGA